jgi:ABC-type multidrug transport system ATPase subunit
MATAIAFRSVTKRFSTGSLALADATFEVAEGAHACLYGQAGSGKTTAVHMVQGDLRPTGGSVLVLGVQVGSPSYRNARRRMGILPQVPGMYPDLTTGEYLALAARLYGVPPDRTVITYGLSEYLHTRMTQLSSGLQRRLALAAAAVADPDVLVLDSPSAGLDPVSAKELRGHLQTAMRGRTTLLCTHDWSEARDLGEEMIILRGGSVAAQGSLPELERRRRPRLRLVAREGNDMLLSQLSDPDLNATPDNGGVLVEVKSAEADAPGLLRRLLDAGIEVYGCSPERPTLEDLFPELTPR